MDVENSCKSDQLEIQTSFRQLGNYFIQFSKYTKATDDKLVITCNNFRNPPYRKVLKGFGLYIYDREDSRGLIAQYPQWDLDLSESSSEKLNTITLAQPPTLNVYEGSSEQPSTTVPV